MPSSAPPSPLSDTPTAPVRRQVSGSMVRALIRRLTQSGRVEAMVPLLGPAGRDAMERPPFSVTRVPAAAVDDLLRALVQAHGREIALQEAEATVREGLAPLLLPLVKTLAEGRGPHASLPRLEVIAQGFLEGVTCSWRESGPREGVLTLRQHDPSPAAWFLLWEGLLRWVLEASGGRGTVGSHRSVPLGTETEFAISWRG